VLSSRSRAAKTAATAATSGRLAVGIGKALAAAAMIASTAIRTSLVATPPVSDEAALAADASAVHCSDCTIAASAAFGVVAATGAFPAAAGAFVGAAGAIAGAAGAIASAAGAIAAAAGANASAAGAIASAAGAIAAATAPTIEVRATFAAAVFVVAATALTEPPFSFRRRLQNEVALKYACLKFRRQILKKTCVP